ncbi:hypothetical protein DFS34DRAFT_419183 [Phlyctochytrium arcticum]|nr:hypothetical protein DFS34DRAFT_419183 [Phlyctochytrium arcticum]
MQTDAQLILEGLERIESKLKLLGINAFPFGSGTSPSVDSIKRKKFPDDLETYYGIEKGVEEITCSLLGQQLPPAMSSLHTLYLRGSFLEMILFNPNPSSARHSKTWKIVRCRYPPPTSSGTELLAYMLHLPVNGLLGKTGLPRMIWLKWTVYIISYSSCFCSVLPFKDPLC